MAKFFEKYQALCLKKNVAPTTAAVKCGFSKAAPNGWKKRGNEPTEFTLLRLSQYFGCDVKDLASDPEETDDNTVRISKEDMNGSIDESINGFRSVPLLATEAAGCPSHSEDSILGYVPCTKALDNLYAIRAAGDSMDRDGIFDGDIVIVHKQMVVDKNDIAVVRIDGDETTISRVLVNGSIVILIPNSSSGNNLPQVYSVMEHTVDILGKVIQCVHDLT